MDAELIRLGVQELAPVLPLETSVTLGTSTAALVTGVPAGGCFFTVECSVAFNINFGTSAVANPAAHYAFAAGSRRYWLDASITHFKVKPSANGYLTSYRSSR